MTRDELYNLENLLDDFVKEVGAEDAATIQNSNDATFRQKLMLHAADNMEKISFTQRWIHAKLLGKSNPPSRAPAL